MANSITKSQIQQVNSLGVGVGLGTSLGLHDTRPLSLSENSIQLDPLSLRITLVIVFVIIFLLVLLVIFIVVCLKRHRCIGHSKSQNSEENVSDRLRSNRTRFNTADNEGSLPRPRTVSHESENSFMNDNEDYLHGVNYISGTTDLEKVSKKSYEPRSQQPDIIEAEIHFVPSYHTYDYAYDHRIYGPSNEQTKLQVQADKLNAPDVNYYRASHEPLRHSPVSYREHQDAQEAKQRYFVQNPIVLRSNFNSPPSSVSPTNITALDMPIQGNAKTKGDHFLTSPLTRLTPSTSSESPQHSVRILTLQDISRKQLQTVGLLLQSTSSSGGISKDIVISNSEMTSWNSPIVSQFSKRSSAPEASSENSSGRPIKNAPLNLLHSDNLQNGGVPLPLAFQSDDCSTTSDSDDDDSFTGSEFCDDEMNPGAIAKITIPNQPENHIDLTGNTETIADSSSPNEECGVFPDAFSMLVSCDNYPKSGAPSLESLEYLLNWGLNFESLMDVFQDLAELPDLEPEIPGNNQSASSPCEIYV